MQISGGRQRQYTLLECQLIEAVKNSLHYELYSNAIFLCERLHGEVPNEEVKLLLAECYLGNLFIFLLIGENKAYKAYYVLKECTSIQNRYKFALVCMKLQKYAEAERALLGKNGFDVYDEMSIAGGAAGYYLLGCICERQARQKDALSYFIKSIEMDPTLWVAFEKICKLAPSVNIATIFPDNHPAILKITAIINSKEYFNNTEQPLNSYVADLTNNVSPSLMEIGSNI